MGLMPKSAARRNVLHTSGGGSCRVGAYLPLPACDRRTPYDGASQFTDDADRDEYRCPQGRSLPRWKTLHTREMIAYRADPATCTACPATAPRHIAIEVTDHITIVDRQRHNDFETVGEIQDF